MFDGAAAQSETTRVARHVVVQDHSAVVSDDKEAMKNSESDSRHSEEVHRGDAVTMVL